MLELPPSERSRVMGASNLKLVEAGVVDWTDVVTEGRVRDLREVVSLRRLSVDAMVKAGVPRRNAEDAYRTVNTAAHDLAAETRRRVAEALKARGLNEAEVKKLVGERLAARVTVGGSSAGPPPAPRPPKPPTPLPTPAPKVAPLTAEQIGKALGITIRPPAPAMRPAGAPVSRAVSVVAGGKVGDAAKGVIRAVDSVHGDGTLPPVPIKQSSSTKKHGEYLRTQSNVPIEINVSDKGDHPRLTTAHEIGHYLDRSGIPGVKSSSGERNFSLAPLFKEWVDAVDASDAVKAVKGLKASRTVTVTKDDGTQATYNVPGSYVVYILQYHEIWARSYAQYIATRGEDPLMRAELDKVRSAVSAAPVKMPTQWSDDDFAPIAKAIDGIFRQLGWVK